MFDQPVSELQVVRQVVADLQAREPIEPADGRHFVAYTDGSCLRNPDGPGGFAAIVTSRASQRTWELAGHLAVTTNNRAEWAGLTCALLFVPAGSTLVAYADSQYVLQIAAGKWKRKANLDLWQAWDQLRAERAVDLELGWVRGHATDPGNQRADALATLAAYRFDRQAWTRARDEPPQAQAARELLGLARGDWEQQFVRNIANRLKRGLALTPKQRAILERISARGQD